MAVVTYNIEGMSCGGCANAIKRALSAQSGIRKVDVDLDAKRVVVDYDETEIAPVDIKSYLEDAGYEAEQMAS